LENLDDKIRSKLTLNLDKIKESQTRIKSAISLLDNDDLVFKAFQLMNETIYQSNMNKSKISNSDIDFKWRFFQLGFILQCLESTIKTEHIDREKVDLLWFPTGGGKRNVITD
jgi:hypothetical protein